MQWSVAIHMFQIKGSKFKLSKFYILFNLVKFMLNKLVIDMVKIICFAEF